jgi:hypothetical protein
MRRITLQLLGIFIVCLACGRTVSPQARTDNMDGTLAGMISDGVGVPISNAYVLIHADGGEKEIVAKVNSQGRFVFLLEPGLYDVLLASSGFAPTCKKLEITSGKTIHFSSRLEADEEHLQHSR